MQTSFELIWLQINRELTSNQVMRLREAYREYKSCEDERRNGRNSRTDESPNHEVRV